MVEKRIPVTEAAQRVVEALDEVVSYELHGNTLHFNFDRPRLVHPSRMIKQQRDDLRRRSDDRDRQRTAGQPGAQAFERVVRRGQIALDAPDSHLRTSSD